MTPARRLAEAVEAAGNPTLHRILANAAGPHFELGPHFRIASRETGAVRRDIPVFAMSEGLVPRGQDDVEGSADARGIRGSPPGSASADAQGSGGSQCVDGVPGAVLVRGVLSPDECDQLIKLTESAGYDEDAPTRLGRHVRHNENCVLVASEAFNDLIFERCRSSLPPVVAGGKLSGINRRWRFYKYHPGDLFRAHIDPGGWTGSGFDAATGRLLPDAFGDRVSMMTFLLYLNDEFEDGATRFFIDPIRPSLGEVGRCRDIVSVSPERGSVLCFFHGEHPLSPWHEGGQLTAGTKYVLRSDVLYKFR